MIDLHSHSTASDGQYSPSEIIQKAFDRGLTAIALTDHDSTSGIEEAQKKAFELGITFIPGIEISILCPGREFHLLGLGLQKTSERLAKITEEIRQNRISRTAKIVEKLNEEGINITLEEIQDSFKGESLGRPHIAQCLAQKGFVKNPQVAFDKYLTRGKSCFVEKAGADLDEAVKAIYESGGIPVIAHPLSLYLSWTSLENQLAEYKNRGVLGMECYHPGARVVECERLETIARRLGFFVTAGSDFHGEKVCRDRRLGITCGQRKIDEKFWKEELEPELLKRR